MFFTIFPKFFSQLPHGTCLLPNSYIYKCADELYHTFAIKSERMRLAQCLPYIHIVMIRKGHSPSLASITYVLDRQLSWWNMCTTRYTRSCSSHGDNALVHSPWLKIDCLVSPPPLSNMLKFSEYSVTMSCGKDEHNRVHIPSTAIVGVLIHVTARRRFALLDH